MMNLQLVFLRESGNCKAVAKFLMQRGWEPKSPAFGKKLLQRLEDHTDVHMDHDYYWGKDSAEVQKVVESKEEGSFLTTVVEFSSFSEVGYGLYYKSSGGVKFHPLKRP